MLNKLDRLIKSFLTLSISAYQRLLSPDHSFWAKAFFPNGYCKFHPTCSSYAQDALRVYILPKALYYIVHRLIRCHPFSNGGIDYVSEVK